MKHMMTLSLFLTSVSAFAVNCETTLLNKINKDPNIRVVKMLDSYSCGESACAVTFEHDSGPYKNLVVLSFLDVKDGIEVKWAPVRQITTGQETIRKNKTSYIQTQNVGTDKIKIEASIETKRDAIFWPPHKVFVKKTVDCSKN